MQSLSRISVVGDARATYHAVVHNLVPVFSGDDAKQQHDGIQRRLKVRLSTAPACSHPRTY